MIQREDESSKTPAPQKTEWEMWLQAVTCIESLMKHSLAGIPE